MALEQLHLTRRGFGRALGAAAGAGLVTALWPASTSLAGNPTGERLHGLSPFGELKYAPDYAHFSWVRVDAPKGGEFNFAPNNWFFNQNVQTYDTLNSFVLNGSAPPRMENCFDALMVPAVDTPGEIYVRLAEWVEIAPDRNTYTFRLKSGENGPRFHDGTPVTAEDVAFSYALVKEEGHPSLLLPMRDLEEVVATDERTVKMRFNGQQSDRAVLGLATYPIFSKAYYSGPDGRTFDDVTLDMPMASGPWRVSRTNPGTFIEYERVADYWGREEPWAVGLNNFDTWRIEFFRDRTAAFEAFKKGNVRYREEFTSKRWATEYDFPAVRDGRVVTKLFDAELRPAMQAWAVNARRPQFRDALTRQAIAHAFDFEWTNRTLFFDAYERSDSLFEKSAFKAEGTPNEAELALLEPLRGKVPEAAFAEPVMQPRSDGSGRDRRLLRRALELFQEAGWERQGGRLLRDGRPLTIEFLIRAPVFERVLSGFVNNLRTLGADASIRLVDASQYQRRLDERDFDITGMAFSFDATPTAEGLRTFFGSEAAERPGSRNYPPVSNEGVDALIDAVSRAGSREELNTAMRALDRVLRSLHAWLPNWYSPNHRVAYWDMFDYPEPKPDYAFPVESYWYYDEAKAERIL